MSGIDDVIDGYRGLPRVALQYGRTVGELVGAAKDPGFGPDGWAPLAEVVDVPNFVRVGTFKEVQNWSQYTAFLTGWAASAEWECSFTRVTEAGGMVFLQLEERSRIGEFRSVVNSLSVYEFTADARIRRIEVYLQAELPASAG
jgi:hypothetical protein